MGPNQKVETAADGRVYAPGDVLLAPHPFAGLRYQFYGFISADPATKFVGGVKSRPQHYKRMEDEDIARLPVRDLMRQPEDGGCWIGFWTVSARIYRTLNTKSRKRWRPDEIINGWEERARFSARGWVWFKLTKSVGEQLPLFIHKRNIHRGQGMTTGKNAEDMYLFKLGKPAIRTRKAFEPIFAPVRQHSRKPREIYDQIELFANGPYAELFARAGKEPRPGWDYWGDEAGTFS